MEAQRPACRLRLWHAVQPQSKDREILEDSDEPRGRRSGDTNHQHSLKDEGAAERHHQTERPKAEPESERIAQPVQQRPEEYFSEEPRTAKHFESVRKGLEQGASVRCESRHEAARNRIVEREDALRREDDAGQYQQHHDEEERRASHRNGQRSAASAGGERRIQRRQQREEEHHGSIE